MSEDVREFGSRVKDCILDAIVGEQLGMGAFRTVYALDDNRVLKVEHRSRSFSNVSEWDIWKEVEDRPELSPWFAPCHHIDSFGTALIQARTKPMTDRQWRSLKLVPDIFCDMKRENWGWLDGRPVCHDYGNHRCFTKALRRVKMVPRDRH